MPLEAPAPYQVSTSLEKILEHRFVAALTTHLWLNGAGEVEVLRGEVDCHGYDLVIEARGVLRHIQLKAMIAGGKRREVGVNVRLASKPSGCVVWMIYDPATLKLGPFLWFGSKPGHPLPPLGNKVGRHSKGNSEGLKLERYGQRQIAKSRFAKLNDVGELSVALFAPPDPVALAISKGRILPQGDQPVAIRRHLPRQDELGKPELHCVADRNDHHDQLLRAHLQARGTDPDTLSVPDRLDWRSGFEFAHLIDGYELAKVAGLGDPFVYQAASLKAAEATGFWDGSTLELWVKLFLEYRREKFSGVIGVDVAEHKSPVIEALCPALMASIKRDFLSRSGAQAN